MQAQTAPPSSCLLSSISCLTVLVLSESCDKTGCLYVRDSHIRVCVSQSGVARPWLGKETFICGRICHEDCGAFLPNLTETSLTLGPCARPSGWQVIMNSHMHHAHARCSVCRLFISYNINMWRHSSTFKLTVILPSDFNSEPDGPHVRCWAEARLPPLSCQGVCFLASPNGSNYTTDTYNCVLSLLMHRMNQCSARVPPFEGEKSKQAVRHKSWSFFFSVAGFWIKGTLNVLWCVLYVALWCVLYGRHRGKPLLAFYTIL